MALMQPILKLPLKDGPAEFHIQIHNRSPGPSVAAFGQRKRYFVMADGHQRFYPMRFQLIEHLVIKSKAY
jgi:hypothetical protein